MWNDNQVKVIERWNRKLTIVWKWLAAALVLRILWGILFIYPSYFPADFSSPFLVDHQGQRPVASESCGWKNATVLANPFLGTIPFGAELYDWIDNRNSLSYRVP
jgi:aspartyl/asparaginyl beta-hydroxylase (cupin superfamily)